ncbi:creatininase family protein [Haloarculaceae archaeon H-GB2-1]|nr:creatininase family protein [Haloarculaceae archaeon H-GB2-1]
MGATEQHGPHLPLGTDTMIGTEIARRVAERLGDALVAPAIPVGCSHDHADFPGTISIDSDALTALLSGYVRSLDRHGFEYVVLLPSHGGNFPPVNAAAPELARDLDAAVVPIANLDRYMDLLNEGLQRAGIDYEEPVVHAGATETAAMAAIRSALVHEDRAVAGPETLDSRAELVNEGFDDVTESGVLGDPAHATPEAGEEILETVADAYAGQVRHERRALGDEE